MTDEIDAANDCAELYRMSALARHQAGNARPADFPTGTGRCRDCGLAIAAARLRALPWAVRCVPCQERHERRGKSNGEE